jgi:hypothetical protein
LATQEPIIDQLLANTPIALVAPSTAEQLLRSERFLPATRSPEQLLLLSAPSAQRLYVVREREARARSPSPDLGESRSRPAPEDRSEQNSARPSARCASAQRIAGRIMRSTEENKRPTNKLGEAERPLRFSQEDRRTHHAKHGGEQKPKPALLFPE